MRLDELRLNAKEFIANPTQREDYAERPSKALIMLKNDRGTNYKTYLAVYNELKGAYNELWDEMARRKYGKPYSEELPIAWKKAIKEEIRLAQSIAATCRPAFITTCRHDC